MQEERRARIRELVGAAIPGRVGSGLVPVTLIVNVSVDSAFKKRVGYA